MADRETQSNPLNHRVSPRPGGTFPFVFARPARDSQIPEELMKRVELCGQGLFKDWAPQVKVLQHDCGRDVPCQFPLPTMPSSSAGYYNIVQAGLTSGWFGDLQTHCGHSSTMEAIKCDVPLIALPIQDDQPEIAAFCTSSFLLLIPLPTTHLYYLLRPASFPYRITGGPLSPETLGD